MKGKSAVSWLCQPKSALVDSNLDAAVADRVRPKLPCGDHTPVMAWPFRPRWAQRHSAPAVSPPRPHSLSAFCSTLPRRRSELVAPLHHSAIAAESSSLALVN